MLTTPEPQDAAGSCAAQPPRTGTGDPGRQGMHERPDCRPALHQRTDRQLPSRPHTRQNRMLAARRPDPAGPASRPRLTRLHRRRSGPVGRWTPRRSRRRRGHSFSAVQIPPRGNLSTVGRNLPGRDRTDRRKSCSPPHPAREHTPGWQREMPARHRRLAGVLASLPAALLASSALSPAAFAAHTPVGASAVRSGGGDDIAFQANTKFLWTTSGPGTGQSLGLGMKAGTSPAIAALPGGGYEAALQANTGHLWVVQNDVEADLGLAIRRVLQPGDGRAAWRREQGGVQANTGHLWVVQNGVGADLGLGMKTGTSPPIAALLAAGTRRRSGQHRSPVGRPQRRRPRPGPGHEDRHQPGDHHPGVRRWVRGGVQANTGQLWVVQNGVGADLGLGMKTGTSPAIAGLELGGYETVFRSATSTCGPPTTAATAGPPKDGKRRRHRPGRQRLRDRVPGQHRLLVGSANGPARTQNSGC